MTTEKPKLTKEQAEEIYDFAHRHGKAAYIERLGAYGYMEKQETAFERAERLYDEWNKDGVICESDDMVVDIYNAYREAIKEMQTALDATKGENDTRTCIENMAFC
jgi:DNA-binding LacI/PurR family transcriptional regulator